MTMAMTRGASWDEARASARREHSRRLAATAMLLGILAASGAALAAVVSL